ncbi:MAG TPA: HepT-like ribonuclease domain-containing protein [Tepidisphaeraceae bacterium]|nr:HepT-like ribonuclease domain-containing protein [Tepidisphaeraceae bacterium]
MLDAVESIIVATHDKTEADFLTSRMLRNTVQWDFAVIGEALSQLHKSDSATAERISEWPRIIGFRNQLIHGYRVIRNTVTWNIVQEKVPILRRELEELLKQ